MKILVKLIKYDGKENVIAKHFAEEFEKFDDYFMINQRGIKETYKFLDLIEQNYEFLVVNLDGEQIINESIKKVKVIPYE